EPDLGCAAAGRHAPDGGLERIGDVEIAVLVEGEVVEQDGSGRIEGGVVDRIERSGVDRLVPVLETDFDDAEAFIGDVEVVVLIGRYAGNGFEGAGLIFHSDGPDEGAGMFVETEDLGRLEIAGHTESGGAGNIDGVLMDQDAFRGAREGYSG